MTRGRHPARAGVAVLTALTAGCATVGASTPPPGPTAPTPPPVEDGSESAARAVRQYAAVLEDIVDAAGLVRYDRLSEDGRLAKLDLVVLALARAPRPEDARERLALWCNAYNANVLVRAHRASLEPGFTGVDSLPGLFGRDPIEVAGETLTLNRLENERIRPEGDPRIHAALVCAALSCPPLRAEPYRGADLDRQLDEQCRRWVNDPTKNRADEGGVAISRIFEWYAADFDAPPYGGVLGFLRRFAEAGTPLASAVSASETPAVTYLPYDWSLNRSSRTAASAATGDGP